MNYKDTLLMPETSFQMRGNLPENEKLQREKWEEMDLYNKIREKNKGKKPFILHDGPPYANGEIHIGHAMNKILKDFVNRYKMMIEALKCLYGIEANITEYEIASCDISKSGHGIYKQLCKKQFS